jgi:hypothetical protein
MRRKWWLVSVVVALIGVLWILAGDQAHVQSLQTAIGLKPLSVERAKTKPICSQAIVPTGADCIPQHMANLPPDPGEPGKATIDGIDADKDGVRDDVQRFIFEQWPESERARRVLYEIAKVGLLRVHHGGELGKEETRKLAPKIMRASACYMGSAQSPELINQSAAERVRVKVTNTPERWVRAAEFDQHLAHSVYALADESTAEACGFDPAALPN